MDYTVHGQVQITMIYLLDEVIIDFDKAEPKGGGTKTSVAPDNISRVDEDFGKLPQSKTVQFHNLVEKTVYSTKRTRLDN